MQGWLKISAAARYMGISPRTLRPLLKKGLKHSKLESGLVLLAVKNIDEYLERLEININEAEQLGNAIESDADRIIREIENGK